MQVELRVAPLLLAYDSEAQVLTGPSSSREVPAHIELSSVQDRCTGTQ